MAEGGNNTKSALTEIHNAMETRESERKRDQFRQRLEIARQGVKSYQEHRVGDAAKAFYSYLRILEDYKNVAENGLHPSLFDKSKDFPEILLISGVYWDLVKMYDRTEAADKQRDFMRYLEKYIQFTKGMPHQQIAGETLRKYIAKGRPKHKEAFKNAYTALTGSKCFIATSLMDVCDEETVVRLQKFRDEKLVKHAAGRVFVKSYYAVSPTLSRGLNRAPDAVRRVVGKALDRLAQALN